MRSSREAGILFVGDMADGSTDPDKLQPPVGGPSGLMVIDPGRESDALGHPQQARFDEWVGDQYMETYLLNGADLDQPNRWYIPSSQMVVRDVVLQLQMSALSGGSPYFFYPTDTWLASPGMQLLYNDKPLRTISPTEQYYYNKANSATEMELVKRLWGTDYISREAAVDKAQAQNLYYLNCRALADTWQWFGPTGAYPSMKWAVEINLLPVNRIVGANVNTTATSPGTVTVQRAELILIGMRESQENIDRIYGFLGRKGVRVMLTEASYSQFLIPAGLEVPATYSNSNLEGEMTSVVWFLRATGNLSGTTNGYEQTDYLNPELWRIYDSPVSTVSIGIQSNPTKMFGRAFPQKTLQLWQPNQSLYGSPSIYIGSFSQQIVPADLSGHTTPEGMSIQIPILVRTGITALPFAENESSDYRFGIYSGSRYIKNDFQISWNFTSGVPSVATTADILIYMRRGIQIGLNGFSAYSEESLPVVVDSGISLAE